MNEKMTARRMSELEARVARLEAALKELRGWAAHDEKRERVISRPMALALDPEAVITLIDKTLKEEP